MWREWQRGRRGTFFKIVRARERSPFYHRGAFFKKILNFFGTVEFLKKSIFIVDFTFCSHFVHFSFCGRGGEERRERK